MSFQSPLITAIVFGISLAFILGTIAHRLKVPPLVGYLLAGVIVGPFTPGLVVDQRLTLQLAEIGVILLMFGVGLHFSLKELISVRRIVVPGTILQVLVSSLLGTGAAWFFGWPLFGCIIFGLCLSVASTVVVLRTLQDHRALDTEYGRLAVGWLVVQDLLTVIALVLLPALSGIFGSGAPQSLNFGVYGSALALTLGKLVLFVAVMLLIGRRVIPAILHYIAHTGSRELFRLAVLSVALGVALAAAELFGVSIALGAFFAGMILSESPLSQRAAEETLPLRDAFAVLFFVSVGMLFNPNVLLDEPWRLVLTFLLVLAGNGALTILICRRFGGSLANAVFVGVVLAQIGEFSFILVDLGVGLKALPPDARDLILGASLLSIMINPAIFYAARSWRRRSEPASKPVSAVLEPEAIEPTHLTDHAVLVGYGRVGRLVATGLQSAEIPFLVLEEAGDARENLRSTGVELIVGNAAQDAILDAANLAAARMIFVAIPEAFEAGQIVQGARKRNPQLRIVARAHFDAEVEHLLQLGADIVIMGEREIAQAMLAEARSFQDSTLETQSGV